MWLLVQGWLLRNVLTILRWLAAGSGVAAVLFGARQAGRNAERMETMRRTIEIQRDQLEAARAAVLVIAAIRRTSLWTSRQRRLQGSSYRIPDQAQDGP
jgi:hypothetical protein